MNTSVSTAALILARIRFRSKQLLIIGSLGVLLSVLVLGTSEIRASAQQAVMQSIQADQAYLPYALQTGDHRAIRSLAHNHHFTLVADQEGSVAANGHQVPALLRQVVNANVPLGILTQGRRPRAPQEATLSLSSADALGVAVGQYVMVPRKGRTQIRARLVGLTVDPADVNTSALVLLNPQLKPGDGTTWLSRIDPYAISQLRPFLDRRTATYQSVQNLVEASSSNLPPILAALLYVPTGVAILVFSIIASTLGLLRPKAQQDVNSLVDAGLVRSAAWRQTLRITFGTLVFGECLGATAVTSAVYLWRSKLSGLFGEQWVSLSLPWKEILFILGMTWLGRALVLKVAKASSARLRRSFSATSERPGALLLARCVFGLGALLELIALHATIEGQPEAPWLVPVGAVFILVASPFLARRFFAARLGSASRALYLQVSVGIRTVAVTGSLIALSTGAYAATATHDANVSQRLSGRQQPVGSFLVSVLPDAAASSLLKVYQSQGGTGFRQYEIPKESQGSLRVTGVRLLHCMRRAKTLIPDQVSNGCFPQQTYAPVNIVVLRPPGPGPATADPGLVEGGQVGLLFYTGTTAKVHGLAETAASPDPVLGGNMPGLVVPEDGHIASVFKLKPSNSSTLALLGFARLTPRERSKVRAAVARLAPSAQTSDATSPSVFDRERSLASTTALLGAAVVILMVAFGGASVVLAHRRTRRTLVDVGATLAYRRGLALRVGGAPAVCFILCSCLTILVAGTVARRSAGGFGAFWVAPSIAGLVVSSVLGVYFALVPGESAD